MVRRVRRRATKPERLGKPRLTKLKRARVIGKTAYPKGPSWEDMGTFSHVLDFSGSNLQTPFEWETPYPADAYIKGPIRLQICNMVMHAVGRSSNGRSITFAIPDTILEHPEVQKILAAPATCTWKFEFTQKVGEVWPYKSRDYSAGELGFKGGPLWPDLKSAEKEEIGLARTPTHAKRMRTSAARIEREVQTQRRRRGR